MAAKSTMLFDCMSNILTTKSLSLYSQHIASENFKDFTKFMALRYMTMHPNQAVRDIVLDNYVSLERLDEKTAYYWLLLHIPRQKSGFIRYVR